MIPQKHSFLVGFNLKRGYQMKTIIIIFLRRNSCSTFSWWKWNEKPEDLRLLFKDQDNTISDMFHCIAGSWLVHWKKRTLKKYNMGAEPSGPSMNGSHMFMLHVYYFKLQTIARLPICTFSINRKQTQNKLSTSMIKIRLITLSNFRFAIVCYFTI